ncbi:hypothetical protein HPP92_018358 [Vanilla planifolia]|uniref:Uncharacterized protein n=1 Tax=Vanilla planifolia TaxID=51239 RepID=A0A835Q801_VANPL|nr:hypothetical protein HPP92_018969 [Vanilla planifolia]KAG0469030.1 hypothetical protein HPP92_018358 [Vanilla planifolia]
MPTWYMMKRAVYYRSLFSGISGFTRLVWDGKEGRGQRRKRKSGRRLGEGRCIGRRCIRSFFRRWGFPSSLSLATAFGSAVNIVAKDYHADMMTGALKSSLFGTQAAGVSNIQLRGFGSE